MFMWLSKSCSSAARKFICWWFFKQLQWHWTVFKVLWKIKKGLPDANLHLCKWVTNDSLVQNVIDDKGNKSEGTPRSN